MHGLEPGTFDGTRESVKFVHPLDAERFAQLLAQCRPSPQRDHQVEFRVVRTDGACRWLAPGAACSSTAMEGRAGWSA